MQEIIHQSEYLPSAASRAVERFYTDRLQHGRVLPETLQKVIDEEKTHAAEVVAIVTNRGVIPRSYQLTGGGLVGEHGEELLPVFDGGIEDCERKVDTVPGAEWELGRREIERQNYLGTILELQPNQACIEISTTDMTKPEAERKAFGYNDDTLIRITARDNESMFSQVNIVIPCSDLHFVRRLRKSITGVDCKIESSGELLSNPDVMYLDKDVLRFAQDIELAVTNNLLRTKPGTAILRMMKRAVDSWNIVDRNEAVFEELASELQKASQLSPSEWERAANMARGGAWQLLIEQAKGKSKGEPKTIAAGIERAMAEGASFTACGGTVDMAEKNLSQIDRLLMTSELRGRQLGIGNCNACQARDVLYGCGVYCYGCNEVWCDEFDRTGKQLEDYEVAARKYLHFFRLPTLNFLTK